MMCAGIQTGKNQNKVQATCSCALNAILTLLFGNIFMTHIAFIHPFSFNWLNAISILIFGNIFMIHVSYIHPSTHQRQECGACPCSHLLRHPHHQCGKTQGGISQRSKEKTWQAKVQPDLRPNFICDLRPNFYLISGSGVLSTVLSHILKKPLPLLRPLQAHCLLKGNYKSQSRWCWQQ